MKKKTYIYNITLTNGELLKNIRSKGGSLQLRFNGIGTNFVPVEDDDGRTVVLSKYQIVKAELVNIEE
ncbi:hypothetical protein [Lentibacillus jeotgali]|uniref:hypothetical protein n=1 Tax=Lentibacillus jeotgali TaxID=558169 RepID=UPI000262741B|nr:hypothetical protein [Lentibacillus jeotgali]